MPELQTGKYGVDEVFSSYLETLNTLNELQKEWMSVQKSLRLNSAQMLNDVKFSKASEQAILDACSLLSLQMKLSMCLSSVASCLSILVKQKAESSSRSGELSASTPEKRTP